MTRPEVQHGTDVIPLDYNYVISQVTIITRPGVQHRTDVIPLDYNYVILQVTIMIRPEVEHKSLFEGLKSEQFISK